MGKQRRGRVLLLSEDTLQLHKFEDNRLEQNSSAGCWDIEYSRYHIVINPFSTEKNVGLNNNGRGNPKERIYLVPFLGNDFLFDEKPLLTLEPIARKPVPRGVILEEFVHSYKVLLREFLSNSKNPTLLGEASMGLHAYFMRYSIQETIKAELVWDIYRSELLLFTSDRKNELSQPDTFEIVQSFGWVLRYLNLLALKIPRHDIGYSMAASFCAIPGVVAKLEYGMPFILTLNAANVMEGYSELRYLQTNSFLKNFLTRYYASVSGLALHFCDRVYASPPNRRDYLTWFSEIPILKESEDLPSTEAALCMENVAVAKAEAEHGRCTNEAELMLQKGIRLYKKGLNEQALPNLRAVYDMDISLCAKIIILYFIAEILERLEKHDEAECELQKIQILKQIDG